jgi:hypothetical protein
VRVSLRTSNGTHYVTAVGGGGSTVVADRRVPSAWETFALRTLEGGPILSGDRVTIWTADDAHLLQAAEGGGAVLTATPSAPGMWDTFVVEWNGSGPIASGDTLSLRTATTPPWYVSAELGGGGAINVNRQSKGAWEVFTVVVP